MGILKIENMTMQFGGLKAVDNFSLELGNEIVAVIGPNGAGKTTVFNVVTGVYQPTQGKVFFEGRDMAGRKPFEFANAGIARTFQNIRLFGNATVLDNLLIAQTNSCGYGLCASLLRTRKFREQEQRMVDRAMELLEVFHLDQFAESLVKNLPYGPQRKLEIARALMTGPKVLLLDEPCAGMVESEMEELRELVLFVKRKFAVSIVLIEHHMSFVMRLADRIKVLDFGVTIAEGSAEEVQNNPRVIEAYLGGGQKNDSEG